MPKRLLPRSSSLLVPVLLLVAALAPRPATAAVDCSNIRTPAKAVDSRLWGELEPTDNGQLPATRDTTDYFGQTLPDSRYPLFSAVDIENGWVFTSYLSGFMVWDARTDPGNPTLVGVRDGWKSHFPLWYRDGENRELIYDVDAPAGRDDLVALAGIAPAGFTIWSTTSKDNPVALYQDQGKETNAVYSAVVNGRAYAFVAAKGGSYPIRGGMGMHVYDMTEATRYNRCADTAEATNCPGVWVARLGGSRNVTAIDGVQTSTGRHILASSGGLLQRGLELWDVSNPSAPQKLHPFTDRLLSTTIVGAVALWEQGNRQYLGVHLPSEARIYDVTGCVTGNCNSIDNSLVWSKVLRDTSKVPADEWFVTFSRSGNTPFLYFGLENFCVGGRQKEFLFDVSNVSEPREITPTKTIAVDGENVDYWGWYDVGSPTGFASVMPRAAKFYGEYLYRAAWSIFDIHRWTRGTPTPPVASFTWSPAQIYPGDVVTFTDTSSGAVDLRQWSFQDGTPSTSAASQPTVTFGSAGTKAVSFTVTNGIGQSSKTQNVTVIDPSPAVAGVAVSPANPVVCQPVTFTANGVTGRPPLNITWEVKNGNGQTVKSGTGNPLVWDTQQTSSPSGTYTGTVTVSNNGGTVSKSAAVTLGGLAPLPASGTFAPTNDPFANGTVTFHLDGVPGATEWNWDFDGDNVFPDANWTNDPVKGPNPTHSFSTPGEKTIRVKVRNCQNPLGVVSGELKITVSQVAPLVIESFQAQSCKFGVCGFEINQTITFDQVVSGGPSKYEYDWDGNGTFEETSSVPVTTHKYGAAGTYVPVLRVTRGSEPSVSRVHGAQPEGTPVIVEGSGSGQPPSISVSGPTSGKPNDSLVYSATASRCSGTVGESGWSWSASGGGSITGSGSSVTIRWTTEGVKTVSAAHSACGSASGSRQVSINNNDNPPPPPPPPGGLGASFTVSPASPKVGEVVTFDGSGSSGSPTSWVWSFGDGGTGEGSQVTHTFSSPGVYTVRLEVAKLGASGPGCEFGVCTAAITKTVTVAGGLQASFATNAECIAEFGVDQCMARPGVAVSLTANAPGATSFFWSFGDGETATGAQVSHSWAQPGFYEVKLTASNDQFTATASRVFVVSPDDNGGGPTSSKAVVLPWIAQTRGALNQSSDLYIHNPSSTAIEVKLQFRRRGLPESRPPEAVRTIQPGATLFVADVLGELFDRENIAGFVNVVVEKGTVEPVINSFNTTFQKDGSQFGQTVPGISLSRTTSAAGSEASSRVQHLVGLSDNDDRLAYFGLSNPGEQPVSYRLRFFDKLGRQIGQSKDGLAVPGFGQKQFQVREIRETFGVTDADDYRVEIETTSGGRLFPYGANLRRASEDPSFVGAGSSNSSKVYLVGALSSPGLKNSIWQSDIVLSNTGTDVVLTDMWFLPVGARSNPTDKVKLRLQPGGTERLTNVIAEKWGITDAPGVLILDSDAPRSVFPVIQGESYDNAKPAKKFGQTIPAFTDADAAGTGKAHYLVGLRQDAKYRTTYWLFNPGTTTGEYEVVYRALDGSVLGRLDVALAAGKARQVSPGQHPIPKAGVEGGFTVQINVKRGKVLSAGQVVNNATNDPAYVKGELR
jgi:PKD repeat protein